MSNPPPRKKQKTMVTENVTDMQEVKHILENLEEVLHDDYLSQVELVEVYATVIRNPKQTENLLKLLSRYFPMAQLLEHLKRIKRETVGDSRTAQLTVLLCDKEELPQLETALASNLAEFDLTPPFVVSVPRRPPLTREQYTEAIRHWPLKSVFVAPERPPHPLFSSSEVRTMKTAMECALSEARTACQEGCGLPIGAVVVDPATGAIVGRGRDRRRQHPLHHAVIVAINYVAEHHRALRTRGQLEPTTYLCTGYDLYATREPCVMCAMAVVHSRFRRVVYGAPHSPAGAEQNGRGGGVGGALGGAPGSPKLHVDKRLNHHFEVYKGLLQKECEALWNVEST